MLTNNLLHLDPHAVKGSRGACLIVNVFLEGVHTPGLGDLPVLSPQIHNVLLHMQRIGLPCLKFST